MAASQILRCRTTARSGTGGRKRCPKAARWKRLAQKRRQEVNSPKRTGSRSAKRHKRHHTKRWYERQLLAIANGELIPTKESHQALIAFGRVRGWNRRRPDPR